METFEITLCAAGRQPPYLTEDMCLKLATLGTILISYMKMTITLGSTPNDKKIS
jgi:hypothetical protein